MRKPAKQIDSATLTEIGWSPAVPGAEPGGRLIGARRHSAETAGLHERAPGITQIIKK